MIKKGFSKITALLLCSLVALSYLSTSATTGSVAPVDTEYEAGYPVMPLDDCPPKYNRD